MKLVTQKISVNAVLLCFAALFLLFYSCDNFNLSMADHIDYATNAAVGYLCEIESNYHDNEDFIALPDLSTESETKVKVFIRNRLRLELDFELQDLSGNTITENFDYNNQYVSFTIPNLVRSTDNHEYILIIKTAERQDTEYKLPKFQFRYFNNDLESLSVSIYGDSKLNDFNKDITEYWVDEDNVSSFNISASLPNNVRSSITTDNNAVPRFDIDNESFSIQTGKSRETVEITVTADSGSKKIYNVTVGTIPQAIIGEQEFIFMQDAINAASGDPNNPTEIIVFRSFTAKNEGYNVINKHVHLVVQQGSGHITITSPSGNHALFTLNNNSTLELRPVEGTSLVLYGGGPTNTGDARRAIFMDSGGTFLMYDRSVIRGFHNSGGSGTGGGAVVLGGGATFTMNGGTIENNHANNSGGAIRIHGATFNMTAGTIRGNTTGGSGGSPVGQGGGVFVGANGKFIMSNGTIERNTAGPAGGTVGQGGGVYLLSDSSSNATFEMSGGNIERNRAGQGGGVYIHSSASQHAKFEMSGGYIYGIDAANFYSPADSRNTVTNPQQTSSTIFVETGNPNAKYVGIKNNDLITSTNYTLPKNPTISGTVAITGSGSNAQLSPTILTATYTGNAINPVFQWQRKEYTATVVNTANWVNIGTNSPTFTPGVNDNYTYRVKVVRSSNTTDELTSRDDNTIDVFRNITAMSEVTDVSGHYRLNTPTITLNSSYSSSLGTNYFNGTFDGGGNTINFYYDYFNPTNNASAPLFNYIGGGGKVTNIKLTGRIDSNASYIGAVANNNSGEISNISSSVQITVTVSGNNNAMAGGIVCINNNTGTIKNCYTTGGVKASSSGLHVIAGGIAARNNGTISYCWASGGMEAYSGNQRAFAAGIAGPAEDSKSNTINYCVALNNSLRANRDDNNTGFVSTNRISNQNNSATQLFTNNFGNQNMSWNIAYQIGDTGNWDSNLSGNNGEDILWATTENSNGSWWTGTNGPRWSTDTVWGDANAHPDRPWKWSGGTTPRPILWFETAVNR